VGYRGYILIYKEKVRRRP